MSFKLPFVSAIALLCVVSSVAQTTPQQRHHRHPVVKQDPPETKPPQPAAPLSPEQMPASPPQVEFKNDTLTINANNATLGDVLRAVHRQTGAAVDMPGNATDRVVGRFGPGPVRDVITSLLNGSHFNYVLMGSASNPNGLERVVLISRSGGMEQPGPASNAGAQAQPVAIAQPGENTQGDDAAEMNQEATDTVDDQANQAPPADEQQPPQQNPFGQGAPVKTPEQLLQELQQRQQQMQQQQQGSPQAFPQAPVQPQQPQQQ